jgi:murein DD-endopeptidase MepM/ murein hydrolase activator NlpD
MEKEKKKLIQRLRNRYRLVIINNATYEEKFSFSLTPMNVFVGFSSFLVFFTTIISLLIVFTPLREYIPGYADDELKKNISTLLLRSDSLEQALKNRDEYYKNIMNIMEGKEPTRDTTALPVDKKTSLINLQSNRELEDELIAEFENRGAEEYAVESKTTESMPDVLQHINMMNPVNGMVSNRFDFQNNHYAVDLVTKPNEAVKAVLGGTVVLSSWTPETGNIIAIQHPNNVLTIYKHNAVLLKKVGTFVSAGDAIAIVGNSGELSSGPHLHFEIWANGSALNPEQFFNF